MNAGIRFGALPPGRYILVGEKVDTYVRRMVPPLARSTARFVELKAGQQIRGILLKMFRPGVISAETYTLSQYATAIVNRIVVVSLPKMV